MTDFMLTVFFSLTGSKLHTGSIFDFVFKACLIKKTSIIVHKMEKAIKPNDTILKSRQYK